MDVHSAGQLEKISEKDEIHIVDDITVSDSFKPIEKFDGIIHGNGYTISGLQSTFIRTVSENSEISEITFKNINFTDSKGLFEENNGCIDSINVKELRKDYGSSMREFGGIVSKNEGSIKNCSVSDAIIYQQGSLGVICSTSTGDSEIINCNIDSTNCTQVGRFAGGIVANAENMSIKDCGISNTDINGTSSIGGIAGYCEDVKVVGSYVESCDLECDEYGVGGAIGEGENTEIRNSSIHTVNLTGGSKISFVGTLLNSDNSNDNEGFIESCSVVNCTATAASDSGVYIFSGRGVVQDCFVRNSEITTSKTNICTNLKELQDSYVDIDIITNSSVNVRECSSDESFYITTKKKTVESKRISVSTPEELEGVGKNDTVELVSDINLAEYDFNKIERFSGKFNGNGHTIYNLTKPLFNYVNGSVRNLNIDQSHIDRYARSGLLSKSIDNGNLRNISITKEYLKPTEQDIYGISHSIEESSIINCTVSFNFTTESESVFGISSYCYRSTVQGCSIEINACNIARGSGVSASFDCSTLRNTHTTGEIRLREKFKKFGGITSNMDDSTITNCSSKIKFTSDSLIIYKNIGGLIGTLHSGSAIKNCVFEGEFQFSNIEGYAYSIGGIAGKVEDGVIQNCHNKADMNINGNGDSSIGGICGENSGKVIKCTNQGNISGVNNIGGLVGVLKGKLIKSKNTANINGNDTIGGITGVMEGKNSLIKNCYNSSDVSGENNVDAVLGTSSESAQLKNVYFIPSTDKQNSKYAEKKSTTEDKLNVILNV